MRIRFVIIIFLFSCIINISLWGLNKQKEYNYSYLTIDNGLCDNSIRAIHKDKNSFMWFGTSNGLDRYDGYEMKHYSASSIHSNLFIESNYIYDIKEDKFQNLWVASDAGILRIDLKKEDICFFKDYKGENHNILSTPIQSIYVDDNQNLWIGKSSCLAYVVLNDDRDILDIVIMKNEVDIRTFESHGNDIWVGGKNLLLRYTYSTQGRYINIPIPSAFDFSDEIVNCLFSFGDYLWTGTQNGLFCLNTKGAYLTQYKHDPKDPQSISSNFILDIAKNDSGDIIVASRNGINVFQRDEKFVLISKDSDSQSLNSNIINKLFVDEENCIWAGSDIGGVNILEPKDLSFVQMLHSIDSGSPVIISAVIEDKQGNILAGMVDGGLAIKMKGDSNFSFYRHQPEDHRSLASNNITSIVQDFNGDYWISTIGGGIDKLLNKDISKPVFEHYTKENSGLLSDDIHDLHIDSLRNSLWICSTNYIHSLDFSSGTINRLQYYTRTKEMPDNMNTLFVDSQSRLWIGGNGVYIIDLADYRKGYECIYYHHKLDDPESKINEKITCIIETKEHEIYLLDEESGNEEYKFINYAARSGLSDTSISNLIEDENGNLWISTLRGIYLFNVYNKRAIKFDRSDGLPVQQFYKRAGFKTAEHNIIMGSTDGLIQFNPLINFSGKKDRQVKFTHIYSNGREIIPYLNEKNISTSITQAKELHLYPPQNSFELSFSSLNYRGQEKIFYFHRIIELNERINVGLVKRNARYTNLSAGKYTFEVWCTNWDNTWSSERTFLTIYVHPPFYKAGWFHSLIILFCVLMAFYFINRYYKRQKNIQRMLKEKIDERTVELVNTISKLKDTQIDIIEKNKQLQTQNEEINKQKNEIYEISSQMEEMNKEKLSYFTNIAHEFKTPLTLILGPISQLLKNNRDNEVSEDLEMINRNASYLISMVNQLIDLQKIDTKNISHNPSSFDLVKLLNQTAGDFSNLMHSRNIRFETYYRLPHSNVVSDKESIHKILFNLLSNAIKYAPAKAKVVLHACQFKDKTSGELIQYISVTNTGSVIKMEDKERIFDRYYRIPDQNKYTQFGQSNTGIGLHIVKELISILNGKIYLKSSKKTGVSFRFYFPISLSDIVETEMIQDTVKPITIEDTISPFIPLDPEKPNLLLVEDNPDMRNYLKKILSVKFNVAEANNGESGYQTAKIVLPDFIVSDLMMPICDGACLCHKIRENAELCHIPFLLLTANSSERAFVEGYENGIDGFITKPFEESILLAQIDAIMKNRDLSQQKFIDGEMSFADLDAGYSDQQFMKEVLEILEKNYQDSNFGVKELIALLNMSYTIVYKKMVSLAGIPPVRFILLYRLKIAKKILERNKNNNVIVSEIAYRVGFNDPKYFTRCFVKQFNITPSSIIYQES